LINCPPIARVPSRWRRLRLAADRRAGRDSWRAWSAAASWLDRRPSKVDLATSGNAATRHAVGVTRGNASRPDRCVPPGQPTKPVSQRLGQQHLQRGRRGAVSVLRAGPAGLFAGLDQPGAERGLWSTKALPWCREQPTASSRVDFRSWVLGGDLRASRRRRRSRGHMIECDLRGAGLTPSPPGGLGDLWRNAPLQGACLTELSAQARRNPADRTTAACRADLAAWVKLRLRHLFGERAVDVHEVLRASRTSRDPRSIRRCPTRRGVGRAGRLAPGWRRARCSPRRPVTDRRPAEGGVPRPVPFDWGRFGSARPGWRWNTMGELRRAGRTLG
jgi:hypothetical protein